MNGRRIEYIEHSTKYLRSFRKLPQHIQQRAREKERIFRQDPFDTRMKTHKLHGKFADYWACSVDYTYRVVFRFLDGHAALFFDIGPHHIYGIE